MKKKFLEELLTFGFTTVTMVTGRWILCLSTPKRDWDSISRWAIWHYIRHPWTVYHHFRAWMILHRAYAV